MHTHEICIYYHSRSMQLIEILPKQLSAAKKSAIENIWTAEIPRKILIALSAEGMMNASALAKHIGHSMSTTHENLKKLENEGLIQTKIIYEKNKQRMITPTVLCVTKNSRTKEALQRFFQGLWVNSRKTQQIIDALNSKPDTFMTAEEISTKTGIPVDEVEILLNNWDSQLTRGVSGFLKEAPFEKKVLYKGKK